MFHGGGGGGGGGGSSTNALDSCRLWRPWHITIGSGSVSTSSTGKRNVGSQFIPCRLWHLAKGCAQKTLSERRVHIFEQVMRHGALSLRNPRSPAWAGIIPFWGRLICKLTTNYRWTSMEIWCHCFLISNLQFCLRFCSATANNFWGMPLCRVCEKCSKML
jgi:hypothetical protein